MDFNSKGLDILKEFEGCSLTAYRDQKGIWTIGYGCTHHVTEGLVISQDEALERLKDDIQITAAIVKSCILPKELNDDQFSACVCIAYNIGTGNFKLSTLLNCIRMGNLNDASNEFQRWNKETIDGNKKESAGLTRRREAEKALFLS